MTNADKYLKDGVDIEELFNDLKSYNDKIKGVTNYYTRDLSIKFLKEFLSQSAKPTLTEDEKVILRNAHSHNGTVLYYIGRDKKGTSTRLLYTRTKYDLFQYDWGCFENLFQFIKPRRRI